jgi:hypothetical protein
MDFGHVRQGPDLAVGARKLDDGVRRIGVVGLNCSLTSRNPRAVG